MFTEEVLFAEVFEQFVNVLEKVSVSIFSFANVTSKMFLPEMAVEFMIVQEPLVTKLTRRVTLVRFIIRISFSTMPGQILPVVPPTFL